MGRWRAYLRRKIEERWLFRLLAGLLLAALVGLTLLGVGRMVGAVGGLAPGAG